MNDLRTFLPHMLKAFNFFIKKSLYNTYLNINTFMDSTTLWVLCPQWQYDNIVDLMNQIPTEKKKETICFFFRKKYPHFLLFHLWNHITVTYIMSKLFLSLIFGGSPDLNRLRLYGFKTRCFCPSEFRSRLIREKREWC